MCILWSVSVYMRINNLNGKWLMEMKLNEITDWNVKKEFRITEIKVKTLNGI